MKKPIYIRALWPVGICAVLFLLVFLVIGGDKAIIAFIVFGWPWWMIAEKLEIPSEYFYYGISVNALICYSIAVVYLYVRPKVHQD